jgi:hypothetical protein
VPVPSPKLSIIALLAAGLAGCSSTGDIVQGGIQQVRSACPAVGIPAGTGDVTLFDPSSSQLATAIDVEAAITNLRFTCSETGTDITTTVTYDVVATRRDNSVARQVTLPTFTSVVQGSNAVVSKRTGAASLSFAAGESRAQASVQTGATVLRSAAELPDEIEDQITRRRKAGEEDAAIDPLSIPTVRQAVLRATFEVLVGFQLTQDQLRYNATR